VQVYNTAVESSEFEQFLHDPTVPKEAKIAGLDAVLDGLKVSELTKRFFGALPDFVSQTLC
jgi:F0F1-type ATP synthase delta subunit